jgi:hypothetical protein
MLSGHEEHDSCIHGPLLFLYKIILVQISDSITLHCVVKFVKRGKHLPILQKFFNNTNLKILPFPCWLAAKAKARSLLNLKGLFYWDFSFLCFVFLFSLNLGGWAK